MKANYHLILFLQKHYNIFRVSKLYTTKIVCVHVYTVYFPFLFIVRKRMTRNTKVSCYFSSSNCKYLLNLQLSEVVLKLIHKHHITFVPFSYVDCVHKWAVIIISSHSYTVPRTSLELSIRLSFHSVSYFVGIYWIQIFLLLAISVYLLIYSSNRPCDHFLSIQSIV